MVYFGVEAGTKGNRLFDPQDGKLRISRDVVFDENEGWNWSRKMEEQNAVVNTFTIISPQPEIPSVSSRPESVETGQPTYESPERTLTRNTSALDPLSSPSMHTSSPSSDIGPRGLRSLADIYENTEIVTLEDEELLMTVQDQPASFKEAVTCKAWQEAMQTEENKMWQLPDLPSGHTTNDFKWVYKEKKV